MRTTLAIALLLAAASPAAAAPTVFSASGANPAGIQSTVDAFRAALGANNGNVAGAQGSGRREINWDGGGAAAPATTFANPMETFAFRGDINTTPGSGFEISGQPSPEFGEINPSYPDIFQPFSNTRLFAPLGSNITDVHFNIPGTASLSAVTNAFGVVFSDVDLATTTAIEFFSFSGSSLGTYYADAADNGLSFLGVLFDSSIVARARITTGNAALGPNDGGSIDVVAMDDFLFGEPSLAVPEPASWALMILGVGATGAMLRRRRAAQPATA
jgi:hypothetical protein